MMWAISNALRRSIACLLAVGCIGISIGEWRVPLVANAATADAETSNVETSNIATATAAAVSASATQLQPFPDTSYQTWKQTDPRWRYLLLGDSHDTMAMSGCAVTSAAILCAMSGAPVPEGFTPGVLCQGIAAAGGFSSTGLLTWSAITSVVPSFHFVKSTTITGKTVAAQTAEIAAAINEGYYVSVYLKTPGSTHFIAVQTVSDGIVRMFDPATRYDSLYAGYDASMVVGLRLFAADKAPNPVLPEDGQAVAYATGSYTVNANLRLRDLPSLSGKILGQIPAGTAVSVTAVSGEWGNCTWNDSTGWMCLNYCTRIAALFSTGQYCTDGNTMNLRSAPSTDASIVGYLPPETVCTVTQISGDWGYCTVGDKAGWMALRFCTCQNSIAEPTKWYTTGSNTMRLRAAASTQAETLAYLPADTVFAVTACTGDWGETVYRDWTGWVNLAYCTAVSDGASVTTTAPPAGSTTTTTTTTTTVTTAAPSTVWTAAVGDCVVVATALNVRQSAAADATWLGKLTQGAIVSLQRCVGDWGQIAWQEGTAWVCLGMAGTPYLLSCGDLNADGSRTSADETLLRAFLQGTQTLTATQLRVADWNGDGMVNIGDLLCFRVRSE